MLWKLLVLFVVVPFVELTLLLYLARLTDPLVALAVVIVTGVVGTILARSQGWKTLRRIQFELGEGKLPTDALLDAAMIFCAGAFLLTPGMLTDTLGLSMLTPFCRRWYRQRLLSWIRRNFKVQAFGSSAPGKQRSQIIDSYVVESPKTERAPSENGADECGE